MTAAPSPAPVVVGGFAEEAEGDGALQLQLLLIVSAVSLCFCVLLVLGSVKYRKMRAQMNTAQTKMKMQQMQMAKSRSMSEGDVRVTSNAINLQDEDTQESDGMYTDDVTTPGDASEAGREQRNDSHAASDATSESMYDADADAEPHVDTAGGNKAIVIQTPFETPHSVGSV